MVIYRAQPLCGTAKKTLYSEFATIKKATNLLSKRKRGKQNGKKQNPLQNLFRRT